jgi:threonine dehydratase
LNKINDLTPVQLVDGVFIKRDDLFNIAGVCGGKARACFKLSEKSKGLVTASSRVSPQAQIVAKIADYLNIPCRIHMPSGKETQEMQYVKEANGEIIQHVFGRNNVIISRAKKDALEKNFTYIPFGMECQEAIDLTSEQVKNIPQEVKRLVVPVGSGITLSGIIQGIKKYNYNIEIFGITVGANPLKRLEKFVPDFSNYCKLFSSKYDYHTKIEEKIGDINLDPIYEAKCKEFIKSGDLLWIVGKRI